MISPYSIILNGKKKGIYESFYWRGLSPDGSKSFWLKHNLLCLSSEDEILTRNGLVIFDKEKRNSSFLFQEKKTRLSELLIEKKTGWLDWGRENFDKGFFDIHANKICGQIEDKPESIEWDLSFLLSRKPYYHYPKNIWYFLPFPKTKLVTSDRFVTFDGTIKNGDSVFPVNGWTGICGHNWGTSHALAYVFSTCNRFLKNEKAFFAGLSAKIPIGSRSSPLLSLCFLEWNGSGYHFDSVLSSMHHEVGCFEKNRWEVVFKNSSHRLKVEVFSSTEASVFLLYEKPSGKGCVEIYNTPFAKGKISLFDLKKNAPLVELESDCFEFETLGL